MKAIKKLCIIVLLNLLGGVALFIPEVGLLYCVSKRRWVEGLFFLFMLIIAKRVLSNIEKRIGIYSKTSVLGRKYGAGITFVAPWVKTKNTNEHNIERAQKKG